MTNEPNNSSQSAVSIRKILLLVPPMLPGEPRNFWISPPLGLLYIAAALEQRGHAVNIRDTVIEEIDMDRLEEVLEQEKPDLVGITCMINTMVRARTAAKIIKEKTSAMVVMGGPNVTSFPEETLDESPETDFAVVGEGEDALHELIEALNAGQSLDNVEGLLHRRDDVVVRNSGRAWIRDLDSIPWPARHMIDLDLYDKKGISAGLRVERRPATSMVISRGCPFRCTFCYKVTGRSYRTRSPLSIVAEMEQLVNEYGIREILFLDDNFTLKKKWVMELCGLILERGLDVTWSCIGRVKPLFADQLAIMRRAGCLRIDLGIETGSERLLKLIKKDVTLEDVRTGVRLIKESGIKPCGYFILGLPTQTIEEAEESIRFAGDLDLDYVAFSSYTPFPGTELSDLAHTTGTIAVEDTAQYDKHQEVYLPEGWKRGDLDRLQRKAYTRFYLRPSYILKQLREVKDIKTFFTKVRGVVYLFFKRLLPLEF